MISLGTYVFNVFYYIKFIMLHTLVYRSIRVFCVGYMGEGGQIVYFVVAGICEASEVQYNKQRIFVLHI